MRDQSGRRGEGMIDAVINIVASHLLQQQHGGLLLRLLLTFVQLRERVCITERTKKMLVCGRSSYHGRICLNRFGFRIVQNFGGV
jgi:hypothetical protein